MNAKTFSVREERFPDVFKELMGHFETHLKEVTVGIPVLEEEYPKMDTSLFATLSAMNRSVVVVLRDESDTMVGYFVGTLFRHPFYECITLNEDMFYLAPEYRGSMPPLGPMLLGEVERAARAHGAEVMTVGIPLQSGGAAIHLLEANGYKDCEHIFFKRLKRMEA